MCIECPKEYGQIDSIFGSVYNLHFATIEVRDLLTGAILQGASHQIFHVLVAFGQIVHLLGLRSVILKRYL